MTLKANCPRCKGTGMNPEYDAFGKLPVECPTCSMSPNAKMICDKCERNVFVTGHDCRPSPHKPEEVGPYTKVMDNPNSHLEVRDLDEQLKHRILHADSLAKALEEALPYLMEGDLTSKIREALAAYRKGS